jgi:hypothetical protein
MKILSQKQWDYELFGKDEQLYLSVLCGSSALFELQVKLNPSEENKYRTEGEKYIVELAEQIRSKPEDWISRKIN